MRRDCNSVKAGAVEDDNADASHHCTAAVCTSPVTAQVTPEELEAMHHDSAAADSVQNSSRIDHSISARVQGATVPPHLANDTQKQQGESYHPPHATGNQITEDESETPSSIPTHFSESNLSCIKPNAIEPKNPSTVWQAWSTAAAPLPYTCDNKWNVQKQPFRRRERLSVGQHVLAKCVFVFMIAVLCQFRAGKTKEKTWPF